MPDDISRIVQAIPLAKAEAEDIGDFPIENRAPGKVDGATPKVKARPESDGTDLAQARVERLSEPKAVLDKTMLPPLTLQGKRGKGFDLRRDARWIKRRAVGIDPEVKREIAEQSKAELAQAVGRFKMRWEK